MDFTLDQLRVLEATARCGSFAAAARELHRVPSAMTYTVKTLEEALGLTLFDRSGGRAALTREGRRVLEAAKDVLDQARALENVAVDLAGGWEAELRVVVDSAFPASLLVAVVARFAGDDVPTRLRMDVECQEGVIDQFERLDADIALYLGFDSDADAAPYHTQALPSLRFVLVAASGHPIHEGPVTPARRLAFAELIVRDSAERFSEHTKPVFTASRNVVYLSDFQTKKEALLSGAGYGWMPRTHIAESLDSGVLKRVGDEGNTWDYQPVIVTRPSGSHGRARALFVKTLGVMTQGVQEF
ncbi:MAG: DNA-binding transcriptional LysR family regulator [Bradymonadia bacterium]|jgi:DNA-binding transcriptional LysR family regulator